MWDKTQQVAKALRHMHQHCQQCTWDNFHLIPFGGQRMVVGHATDESHPQQENTGRRNGGWCNTK